MEGRTPYVLVNFQSFACVTCRLGARPGGKLDHFHSASHSLADILAHLHILEEILGPPCWHIDTIAHLKSTSYGVQESGKTTLIASLTFLAFSCSCADGWLGENCEGRKAFCTGPEDGCGRGPSCTAMSGGDRCECPLGRTGRRCEKSKRRSMPYGTKYLFWAIIISAPRLKKQGGGQFALHALERCYLSPEEAAAKSV